MAHLVLFYNLCAGINFHSFIHSFFHPLQNLIQETQRQSKAVDKNIPVRIKSEDFPQGQATFNQYKKFAEDQIRHATSVQEALEICIKQLAESARSIQPIDPKTDENADEAECSPEKKVKLEVEDNAEAGNVV